MRAFGAVADTVIRDSARMRTALGGTGRAVDQLRSQMGRGYQFRLFNDVLRQAASANNEVARLRATMLALSAITGTSVTGGFAAAFLLQTADASNRLNNQLRTVTDTEENLIAVRKRLYDVSQDARADLQSTVTLYARVSRAAKEFGKSQEDLVKVAETVQKAFAIGGASQQEASGAAIQLSQGIASDRFSGEEYRSVAENAPVLLQEMARHLGVSIGKLREMAHAGELTGRVVTDAILGASAAIDRDFNKTIPTVSQSLTRLNNAFLQNIGETDTAYGLTRRLSEGLSNLARNFDDVAKYAGIATVAVGALLAGRAAPGLIGKAGGGLSGLFVGGAGLAAKAEIAEMAKLHGQLKSELAAIRQQAGVTVGANGKMSFVATPANLALMDQYNEKMKTLQQVQLRAAKATTELSRATRALAVAGRAAGGALAFFGGPVGIGLMLAVGGLALMGERSAQAAERTNRLKKEMLDLGLISKDFAGQIAGANKSIEELTLDELRSKMADIRTEIFLQQNGHPWWDKLFGQDTDNLTDNLERIQSVLAGFSANAPFSAIGLGVNIGGFQQGDIPFLQQLENLATKAREGKLTAAEFKEEWDRISPTFRTVSKNASDMATNVGRSIAVMEGLGLLAKEHAAAADNIIKSGRGGLLESLDARTDAVVAAIANAKSNAEILKAITDQSVSDAGRTDAEKRIADEMERQRKAAQEIADQKGIAYTEDVKALRSSAQAVTAAQDAAEAAKKIAELRASLNADGLTLVDRGAVSDVNNLFDQFRNGTIDVETMQSRLKEISKLRLSDTMDGLIDKIVAAIPELATLLGIAQSFPGVGGLPGPVYGRGAVGRSKRRLAEKYKIGADVASEALSDAGLSDRDAAIKQRAEKLIEEAKKRGGLISREDATARAAAIVDLEESMKGAADAADDAAEAAKKYADGLADMEAELALIPMGEFVKSVYDQAESLGVSRKELDGFISSVQSGGIDAAPVKFKAIADAMREINAANIMRDLAAERDLLFKGDAERNVYETLKDSGIALDSVQGQIIANQIRMNHVLGEARDIAVDFGQTFRTSFAQYMAEADAAHEESRLQHINELLQEAGATGEEVSLAQRKAILEMADAMADAEHGATFMERAWKAAWKAIVDATTNAMETIASKLMEAGINGLFDNLLGTGGGGGNNLFGSILGAIFGGLTGGFGSIAGGAAIPAGGFIPGITGPRLFAKGGIMSGPGISAFSNSVVTQPTIFPFAKGIGMMGEAGWEAVMPLKRGPDGRLGVSVANQNMPVAANRNGDTIEINITGSRHDAAAIARATEATVHRVITQRQRNPYRR